MSLTNLPAQADPPNPADDINFIMDPATDIAACAGNSECFAFTVDTRLTSTGATTGTETTFSIPTSGYINRPVVGNYNWIINWGDGSGDQTVSGASGTSGTNANGIPHDYTSTGGAKQYQITIRPNIATPASGWFDAFGFYENTTGANADANKYKFRSIDTPFTNLMRSNNSIYRFSHIFYGARNGLGIPSQLFANISTTGATIYGMFYNTFGHYASNSTTGTIPVGLFSAIDTSSATNLSYMFDNTFFAYASNSTTGTIPVGLFSAIDTSSAANLSYMFRSTFYQYATNSTTGTIPVGLFSAIDTSSAANLGSIFDTTFYQYATNSTTGTIPVGLFSTITIPATATNLSYMFDSTFSFYATNSTTGTIPVGLFSTITIPATATNLSYMFRNTFYNYAYNSTTGTIPAGLFSSITIPSGATTSNMFNNTFQSYARRTATFKVGASSVGTQAFTSPYSTKISPNGTPSTNPTVAAGDVIYPTYNDTARTINAPTGIYTGYSWYYKDGTSCSVGSPTPDCGPQDSTTLASFPNTTEWTPETSTEKGNVTFYGVFNLVLELSLDSNDLKIGGSAGVTPTTTGAFAYASNIATVKTNNPKGYRLDISTNTTDSNMKHLSISGANIPATSGTWSSKAALANNTWGFTLTANPTDSAAIWAAVSNLSSPLTVKSTTTPNITGDNTTINYGAKVDLTQVAGQYQTTIVYTALANP